jgi:hypothetical protein
MDKISNSWNEMIKEAGSATAARTDAKSLYNKKYTQGSKSGEIEYNGGLFKAGLVYTFIYADSNASNNRPLLLSMGSFKNGNNLYETGIDICMIPPDFRNFILDRFISFYDKDLNENVKLVEDNKNPKTLQFGWKEATRALGRTGWQAATFAYDKSKIKQVSIIDYDDWGALVGIQTGGEKDLIKIYNTYIKKAQNRISTQPSWIENMQDIAAAKLRATQIANEKKAANIAKAIIQKNK